MNKELIKQAFQAGYAQGLKKQGGALSDVLASMSPVNIALNAIPFAGPAVNDTASIVGAFNPSTEEQEAEYDKHPVLPWLVPGLAAYRNSRRWSANSKGHRLSQAFGPMTSALVSTGLGAGLGAGIGALSGKLSGRDVLSSVGSGATLGGAVGAGAHVLGTLGSAIAALIKKRRTDDEQAKYRSSSVLPEYLIPGVATYNGFKTLGNTIGKSKRRREASESADKERKSKESAKSTEIADLEHQVRIAQLKQQLAQLTA